jgi:hypothetical protein
MLMASCAGPQVAQTKLVEADVRMMYKKHKKELQVRRRRLARIDSSPTPQCASWRWMCMTEAYIIEISVGRSYRSAAATWPAFHRPSASTSCIKAPFPS